jgi:hypothetical protein
MLSIALKDRDTLETTGYLRLSLDQQRAHSVKVCSKASHFRSATAAALVGARFKTTFRNMPIVQDCHCIAGLALSHELGDPWLPN